MSSPNSGSVSFLNRHPKYYIDSADLHIVAGKTLFRVHGYFFDRESAVFHRKINPSSPGDTKEGTTDQDPVILDVSPEEFEQFLWVFYNPRYSIYEGTVDQWRTILHLADKWVFHEVKELAVRELHKQPTLSLVEKMALYQAHSVDPRHLVPLYAELCERDMSLSLQESKILGLDAAMLVMGMREKLRAKPSEGGRSPLPEGLEKDDVYRAVEGELGIDVGSTTKFEEEKGISSPTAASSLNGNGNVNGKQQNGTRGSAAPRGGKGSVRK